MPWLVRINNIRPLASEPLSIAARYSSTDLTGLRFHFDDDDSAGQAGPIGKAAGADAGDDDALARLDAEFFGHLGREVVHFDTQLLIAERVLFYRASWVRLDSCHSRPVVRGQ